MNKKIVYLGCIIFCLALFRGLAEANSEISKEWQACQSNEDCTAGVGCCECWEPINKKYIKEIISIYNNCSGACDGSCKPENQPATSCVQGQCKAMYQQPRMNISMQQWEKENIEKAIAVLEVEVNEKINVCDKYCSQKVRIVKVLKNKSDYIFPELIDVYFYSWKKEIPKGHSVINIEKYNPDRNDLWKLVDESG